MATELVPVVEPCTVPLWWTLLRDTALLLVGLGGILYQHLVPSADVSTLTVVTDLVLVGLIPLGHLLQRLPRARVVVERPHPPEPPQHVAEPGSFDPRVEGPGY